MTTELIISEVINKNSATLHSDGLKLYSEILSTFKFGRDLRISFKGLEYCTTAFLNASIGKFLSEKENPESVMKNLILADFSDDSIKEKIEKVLELAMDEKKREIHNQSIREEIHA